MHPRSRPLRRALAVLVASTLVVSTGACASDDGPDAVGPAPTSEPADGTTTERPGPTGPEDQTDPDAPVSSPPVSGDDQPGGPGVPVDGTPIDAADAEVLIGLTVAAAETEAAGRGWTVRVARLDSEDLALTEDYSPTRVNVAVEDDVVTEILSIG